MIKYFLAIVLLGINWATGYVIAGYCVSHGMTPINYAFWQSFGPFIILFGFALIYRKKISYEGAACKFYLFCAIFGTLVPSLLIYYAAQYVNTAILTLLANLAPLFTYLLAVFFRGERFRWLRFGFVILGLIGVGMIMLASNGRDLFLNWQAEVHHIWLYLLLLVPLSYAVVVVYIDRFPSGQISYTAKALGMLFFASIGLLPLALSDGIYILDIHDIKTQLLLLEIAISVFDSLLVFFIINSAGVVYYTMVNAITSLAGVVYGCIIYHRSYSMVVYYALGIVIVSIIGINLTQQRLPRS